MKFYLTVFLIVVNCGVFAQFSEDFTDGDFTTAPTWTGDAANFIVNTSNELQLNAPAVSDTSYLSLSTTSINNTTWDFYVKLDFNPSSSNLARVYLVSDNADLKGSLNGYFVMIGNTEDEISLYRQDGTTITELIDGADNSLNTASVVCRIRVTRDGVGNWELLRDTTAGYAFISEGVVLDASHTTNANFGVFCQYTSTRSDKFFFDDLGDPYIDTIVPTLDSVAVVSSTELEVHFSEIIDQPTAENITNYSVDNGIGAPQSATVDAIDETIIHLIFSSPFVNGTDYLLTANNVEDLAGNAIPSPSTAAFFYFVPETPVLNDIIITEFLPDPSPPVGLPEVEYVELYNRSDKYFDLSGWTLSDASSTSTFNNYVFAPDTYVLICNNGEGSQFFVANYTEISLPSLNNSADDIVVKDDLGNTIDSISFDLSWYHDSEKEAGGWSIERKHLNTLCNDKNNWAASTDPIGGTPALQNAIWTDQDDIIPPQIENYEVISDTEVLLYFNEIMDTSQVPTVNITPAVNTIDGNWQGLQILSITVQTLLLNQLYELQITNAFDCWGNEGTTLSINFGLPDTVVRGDLIINEVMFNPLTGGSDYVEIYNRSDKIVDLREMMLANWDDSVANHKLITADQRLLLPESYVLITADTNDIIKDFSIYGLGTFVQATLPTYPNDSGTVYFLSKDGIVLDEFHYDEDYHFELLSTADGKALERITFSGETNDPDNWHTAAEDVEWGTPGYENSQSLSPVITGDVSSYPQMFSPDNDGYQDVVTINLDLPTNENIVDIEIFDNRGRLVRELKDNFFAGNQATFTWDGINDEGEKAAVGAYIILVSVTDLNGDQQQYKLVTVLAADL
ncbi:MAG: lamin tail domain-containing protein [Crocinitomicaceae bacterium]